MGLPILRYVSLTKTRRLFFYADDRCSSGITPSRNPHRLRAPEPLNVIRRIGDPAAGVDERTLEVDRRQLVAGRH
jgi:hypothetical protein